MAKPPAPPAKPPRKKRVVARRHPLLRDRPRGVWYPDLVGKVPNYPKSQEDFNQRGVVCRAMAAKALAEGKTGRCGIPDGWGGPKRRKLLAIVKATAKVDAIEMVKKMKERDLLEGEDPRGDAVIQEAFEIALAIDPDTQKPVFGVKDRLAAMSLVAKYTKAMPTIRQTTKLETAEDFLGALAVSLSK